MPVMPVLRTQFSQDFRSTYLDALTGKIKYPNSCIKRYRSISIQIWSSVVVIVLLRYRSTEVRFNTQPTLKLVCVSGKVTRRKVKVTEEVITSHQKDGEWSGEWGSYGRVIRGPFCHDGWVGVTGYDIEKTCTRN